MCGSVLQNLRDVLGVSALDITSRSGVTAGHLLAIEQGEKPPTETFIKAYSEILNIRVGILRILFLGAEREVPGFDTLRALALKVLNGYLKFSLWMMAFNETEEKVPR